MKTPEAPGISETSVFEDLQKNKKVHMMIICLTSNKKCQQSFPKLNEEMI